jgi:hypothetical protein
MSLETALVRIAEIQRAFAPAAPRPASGANFSAVLGAQTAAVAPTTMGAPATAAGWTAAPSAGGGLGALQAAQAEVGVTEQPPGSNDGPRIAQYRQATAGSGVGPWCAYFVSWAAAQAGVPLGEQGQGFGAVSAVWDWASRTGRAIPAGGAPPQPGDLIVWGGRHIGIVESVDANGSIHTVEGNSSDAVSRRTYGPDGGGATGYVRLS